jgi:hypothetical protein
MRRYSRLFRSHEQRELTVCVLIGFFVGAFIGAVLAEQPGAVLGAIFGMAVGLASAPNEPVSGGRVSLSARSRPDKPVFDASRLSHWRKRRQR